MASDFVQSIERQIAVAADNFNRAVREFELALFATTSEPHPGDCLQHDDYLQRLHDEMDRRRVTLEILLAQIEPPETNTTDVSDEPAGAED